MEARTFNEAIRAGNLNPFAQAGIVLCSYQFARGKEPYVRQMAWDLVVIDEAHRLRNVYKTSSRIASAIKQAVSPFPKVLLTATPLQNSLLELYGLVSIIDDYAFGDLPSFRARFARLGNQSDFSELKERLKPICKRTLRRQVLEYVSYTDRHALVQEFAPSADEQKLYDLVSDYLQRPTLFALPAGQRQLMTLILSKLLASSTYAISGTLEGLAKKLEAAADAAEEVDVPPDELPEELEGFNELADEWDGDEEEFAIAAGINAGAIGAIARGVGPTSSVQATRRVNNEKLEGRGAAHGTATRFCRRCQSARKGRREATAESSHLYGIAPYPGLSAPRP